MKGSLHIPQSTGTGASTSDFLGGNIRNTICKGFFTPSAEMHLAYSTASTNLAKEMFNPHDIKKASISQRKTAIINNTTQNNVGAR